MGQRFVKLGADGEALERLADELNKPQPQQPDSLESPGSRLRRRLAGASEWEWAREAAILLKTAGPQSRLLPSSVVRKFNELARRLRYGWRSPRIFERTVIGGGSSLIP